MNFKNLMSTLNQFDIHSNKAFFTFNELSILFPEEQNTLKKSLKRHTNNGLIKRVSKGIYVNESASSFKSLNAIFDLIEILRPDSFNYISRESCLSMMGNISQLTMSVVTATTTGSKGLVKTPYGNIEFTHTKKLMHDIYPRCVFNEQDKVWYASKELALEELTLSNRNLGMVRS